jgi:hypothetical protein
MASVKASLQQSREQLQEKEVAYSLLQEQYSQVRACVGTHFSKAMDSPHPMPIICMTMLCMYVVVCVYVTVRVFSRLEGKLAGKGNLMEGGGADHIRISAEDVWPCGGGGGKHSLPGG